MKFAHICKECDEPAFYLDNRPEQGKPLDAATVTFPDGSKPDARTKIRCGNCNCFPGLTAGQYREVDSLPPLELGDNTTGEVEADNH